MQAELDLTKQPAPVAPSEVAELVAYLLARPEGEKGERIAADLRMPKRKVRQLAEASVGVIVSGPGSNGYKHISHCSSDEVDEAANRLNSQGDRMKARANSIRRAKANH